MLNRRIAQHLLQYRCEVFDDYDGFDAGILELVLHFAWRIERIDVDDDHAGAQDAQQRHRVLQQIRGHDGDSCALGQARQPLQKRGERT